MSKSPLPVLQFTVKEVALFELTSDKHANTWEELHRSQNSIKYRNPNQHSKRGKAGLHLEYLHLPVENSQRTWLRANRNDTLIIYLMANKN